MRNRLDGAAFETTTFNFIYFVVLKAQWAVLWGQGGGSEINLFSSIFQLETQISLQYSLLGSVRDRAIEMFNTLSGIYFSSSKYTLPPPHLNFKIVTPPLILPSNIVRPLTLAHHKLNMIPIWIRRTI